MALKFKISIYLLSKGLNAAKALPAQSLIVTISFPTSQWV